MQPMRTLLFAGPKPRMKVQTFGNFEVYAGGQAVRFSRRKAKELLAYLVHKQGASCTAREVAAILFEDKNCDKKQLDYLNKIVQSLRAGLAAVGAADILQIGFNSYAVDSTRLDCDYYCFLNDSGADARKKYRGEYMAQYSWAEPTASFLNFKV